MDKQQKAYEAGARVSRERIRNERPQDAEILEKIEAADIVVRRGAYDHVHRVLRALKIPHVVAKGAAAIERMRPGQLLIVNCDSNSPIPEELEAMRRFLEGGGSMMSTDWALSNVIPYIAPGRISYNGRATGDEVVAVEVVDVTSPWLAGVIDGQDTPVWWLEGSSHPIQVDSDRVEVLIRSRELGQRYGADAVAVRFGVGEGEIIHMISHYYLQRVETRTERHRSSSADYAREKGVRIDKDLDGLNVAEVESASSSARLLANIAIEARKKRKD